MKRLIATSAVVMALLTSVQADFEFGDVFIDLKKANFEFGDVFKDMK